MSKSLPRRKQWLQYSGFLVVFMLVGSAVAFAQVNAVYIENNIGQIANRNAILGLSNDGTGNLTPLPGGQVLSNGTGVFSATAVNGPSFQSDQQVVVNAAGTLLFAVNGGSNTISVFSIASTGVLTLLSTTPFPSNGSEPVSLGLDENSPVGPYMVVVNQAGDPAQPGQTPNITAFRVDETAGTLTPVGSSTVTFPDGSLPGQVLISPSGRFAFVVQFQGGGDFCSYAIGGVGKLILNNCFGPSVGTSFLGAVLHPKKRAAYVGMPGEGFFSVFNYNPGGGLSFARLVGNNGSNIGFMTTNKLGTRLYTSERDSNTVSVYDISAANFNSPLQLQFFSLTRGEAAANIKLDPTEKFLYVLGLNASGTTGNFLHVLNVAADGTLSETQPALKLPIHAGEIPMGLAVVQR
jgi:6-phosphogluconolactonase (cycloisomerase 2 family)